MSNGFKSNQLSSLAPERTIFRNYHHGLDYIMTDIGVFEPADPGLRTGNNLLYSSSLLDVPDRVLTRELGYLLELFCQEPFADELDEL